MSQGNAAGANSAVVDDAVRVVEDTVDATEAWNGPLFDIWIEYRRQAEDR